MSFFAFSIAAAAFLTAALSGIAGVGGGTILIGVFYAIGLSTAQAVPLHAAVQLASNASRTVAYFSAVEWRAAGWFMLGCAPAPFLIAPYVPLVNTHIIELVLGVLIIASLIPGKKADDFLPLRWAYLIAGVLVGSIGMFVGASGLFVGRLFLRPEWRKETMIGTLALCQCLGHATKLLGYGTVGLSPFEQMDLLVPLVIAVILGTVVGKQLNQRLSEERFRTLVNAVLLIMSVKLLWDGVHGLMKAGA
ncbi:sulfite exporter TauE/SafE family protein [Stenotrophobium rhamnosiphilum]|uniref:Probable membrane transporter protein n=1 Tax=Stenotrophobium rhamnosiphilum TaxID=2029166 RepID=A0A2T5MFE8_9GAMM|nr:sulfite exporter TauE/SafE family protein [Stenotrophobium rhamnosiphilum]PTU31311.1 sulfite exporter TauE/SafE family protein [Stenotrophobium rhamnosiphilum]